jgi:hypothetical protein
MVPVGYSRRDLYGVGYILFRLFPARFGTRNRLTRYK